MRTYLCVYFGSAFLAQFGTLFVARLARALNLTDKPGARKVHKTPVPRIGGVAIMLGTLAATLAVLTLNNVIGNAFRAIHSQVIVLLGASFFVFMVGLFDDIRSIPSRIKLLTLIAASLALCSTGARIEEISVEGLFTLHLGWFSWPLTVMWICGVTVAMNFIDGLDGLAAGIALIVTAVIAVMAFTGGQVVMGVLMLALMGSLTGFLFFNFNPAKIFMGDCGSMFLGFVIGAGSVVCQAKSSTLVGIALPALALGVPLFDTLLTLIRRKVLDRRSLFSAERGHIHHRLLDKGLNQRYAVFALYGMTLASAGLGMLMFVTNGAGSLAVIACGILLLLLVFRMAGASRLRETKAAIHRNAAISRQAKEERHRFEDVQLQIRRARCFDEWWEAICRMAEEMEFDRLALVYRLRPSTTNTYVWRRSEQEPRPEDVVRSTLPLGRHGGATGSMRLELAARINGSLETTCRRMSLFGRLIDENCPSTVISPGDRAITDRESAPARQAIDWSTLAMDALARSRTADSPQAQRESES